MKKLTKILVLVVLLVGVISMSWGAKCYKEHNRMKAKQYVEQLHNNGYRVTILNRHGLLGYEIDAYTSIFDDVPDVYVFN